MPGNTADKGFVNPRNQENMGRVLPLRQNPKTYQFIHDMKCLDCGCEYHAWSGDIFQRKCPQHDNGAPGPILEDGNLVW